MKQKYSIVVFIISAFVCSAMSATEMSCKEKGITHEEALKIIQALPEVQGFTDQLRKKNIRPFVRQEPPQNQSHSLEFSVGESYPTHTVLWNRFSIDSKSGDVFIFNSESDSFIPLDQWRKKK